MSLHEQILADMITAMKAKDAARLSVLRMLKSAFLLAQKEGGADATTLPDERVMEILKKEVKKRNESAEAFRTGNRPELAEKEEAEKAIIESYLPAPMSADEVKAVVNRVIEQHGKENFGAVMGAAMKELKGQADGQQVRAMVNELLGAK